jgi:hypothetical protein
LASSVPMTRAPTTRIKKIAFDRLLVQKPARIAIVLTAAVLVIAFTLPSHSQNILSWLSIGGGDCHVKAEQGFVS